MQIKETIYRFLFKHLKGFNEFVPPDTILKQDIEYKTCGCFVVDRFKLKCYCDEHYTNAKRLGSL